MSWRMVILLLLIGLLAAALRGGGQGPGEDVGIVVTHQGAFEKFDIKVNMLDVLSGGADAVATADRIERVLKQDLQYSGLIRTALQPGDTDSLAFEFTIEGTVEGPLRDADPDRRDRAHGDQPEPAQLPGTAAPAEQALPAPAQPAAHVGPSFR